MAQLKTQNSKLKTIIRWLLGVLLLILVLWIVFILAGRALPHIAVGQITELTNTKIKAESVDFNIDGSVFIKKLVVSPYKKQSYDDTILRAETVYARFGIGSLLLLRPRLKVIDVNDFVFNAQYDVDTGRWNLSALKIKFPQSGSGKMPRIRLEAGTLQYSKISNGKIDIVASVPLKASFGFDEQTQQGYSFDMTTATMAGGFGKSHLTGFWRPGKITVAGGVSSTDVPSLEMAWAIDVLAAEFKYDPDSAYSLKLRIRDFRSKRSPAMDKFALVGQSFLERFGLFAALKGFFARFSPAGRIDIYLDASGNLKQPAQSILAGKIICSDVSICDRKFPYPIEHLTGQIDFTKNSATLNNLVGRHGDVKLFFNGWSRDFGPKRQYEIQVTSGNMVLDDGLYNALSEKQQRLWSAFSPSGLVGIDYHQRRLAPTVKEKTLIVELLGTDATYKHFPYPLKNLAGKLFFDRDGITFSDIVSQVDDRKITINGKILSGGADVTLQSAYSTEAAAKAGSSLRSTSRPLYNVSIDVNNIPLDSTLEAALPDRQRHLYNQFSPTGLADGQIKVFASKQDESPATFMADLSFKKGTLKLADVPLAISDISAQAVFMPDSVRIDNFTGRHADGLLSLTGRIWLGQKTRQLRYSLTLNAKNAQLNSELFDLLPEPLEKIVSEFQPQGKVNYTADLNKADPNNYPDYRITVDYLDNSINHRRFPYPLKDITGNLTITKDSIELKDITATAADSLHIGPNTPTIKLNGEIALADNALSGGWLQLSANNILFDEQLGVALPDHIKPFYRQLSPTGRFDVNLPTIKISGAETSKKYIDFDGIVRFKDCNFNLPCAITGLNGVLTTKGLYKTGEGLHNVQAILSAARIRIQDKSFNNLKADIYYDHDRQNWFTENLVADCYGGRLAGKFAFKQPADASSEYLLQVGFDNIDLKQFLSDRPPRLSAQADVGAPVTSNESQSNGYTGGKMSGSLAVSTQIGESAVGGSRIGRCRLAISDMQAGKLSPIAKLLQVLKLTEPKDFAFDRMLVDSYIKHDRLFFQTLDLSGRALAFYGSGWMDLQTQNVDLILTARGDRLASDPSVLQSLAEGLGGAVVRVEITGNVYNPLVETRTFPVIQDSLHILGTKEPVQKQ